MTDLLKTETTSIVEAARKKFKEVNDQLAQLYELTKKKIEQETQDRINSDTTIKKAGEAALKTITCPKRKLRDPEDPLGTTSTKRQRPAPDTTRHSQQQSEIPQPPPTKKETQNVPQPDKYDGSSAKLKAFLNDVATVFEHMPVTYKTGNKKILYVGALLTNSANTWYLAYEQKRKPDPLSGWTVWVTYEDFLKDFIAIHENKNEVREAKRNLQMEYQKSGERIKDYVSRMHIHNMLANLPREQLWECLIIGLQADIREYMKRMNKDCLDLAPASPEMCFQTIIKAGMDVENEKQREPWMQNQCKLKEQTATAAKGRKPEHKPEHKPSIDKKKEPPKAAGIQKQKSKLADKWKSTATSDKSTTSSKREKEPGEDKVTYYMRQAYMKEGQCIKCGSKDHIKKECTSGWKPAAEGSGKDKRKDKVDNKKVAVVQAADALISSVVASVSFGRIISEDELDYESD